MAQSNLKQLHRKDYHVVWVCPGVALDPARLMLEEEHDRPVYDANYDDNTYICGTMEGHNVVLATNPPGMAGNVTAGRLAVPIFKTFPNVKMTMLIGIGGGVPSPTPADDTLKDIHLGDVVVGWPGDGKQAVVYYESGRLHSDKFEILGTIDRPDWVLLNALGILESYHKFGTTRFSEHLKRLDKHKQFAHPDLQQDKLFQPSYGHKEGKESCAECDDREMVYRNPRTREHQDQFIFHRGRIGTGNAIVVDANQRDLISERCGGLQCIEMSAAGVDASRNCLVIRGISDYCDTHKNGVWKHYAAAKAAVFGRELLRMITPRQVDDRYFMVPFGRNKGFVGRKSILDELLKIIPPSVEKEDCQRTVVEGLGGIGKTQIALEAAYRVGNKYLDCSVFWVPAINLTSFENAYREIGRLLQLPGIDDEKADVKLLVKTGLSQKSAGSWLLIIDNADDRELSSTTPVEDSKRSPESLADFLPFSREGSILCTTRNRKIASALGISKERIISVPDMDDAEATELLRKDLQDSQIADTKITKRLLSFLTNLPLAIKQASAYMVENRMVTVSDYLETCRSSDADLIEMLSEEFEDLHRYRDHAKNQNPVATTWLISFQSISQYDPQAADYLKFICFLAEKDIPLSLLPVASEVKMKKSISTLQAYAFIIERDISGTFDIHRLVRLVMQNWLQVNGKWNEWAINVIQQLAKVYPFPKHENKKIWMPYLPHGQAGLEIYSKITAKGDTSLIFNIAQSYFTLGKYNEAERLYQQTLELKEEVLGREHPSILGSINNLAEVLRSQGKYEEAEKINREILRLREKVLGRKHPDTLASMNNLANVLDNQGKYEKAEKIHREALRLNEEVLSKEHPSTLASMNNLANVLDNQGKYEEAEKIHREALRLNEEVLGREHPDTLDSMNNLANVLVRQEKYEEAEDMHRRGLELREEVLDRKNPDTLTSMNNLACVLDSQGKYEEAEKMHRETLELREEVLGRKHPDTVDSMNNLACVLDSQGKYEEAEKMHRETLELRKEVLGRKHPNTVDSINNLACVLDSQGKYKEAEEMYRQTLGLTEEVLGREHPDTLSSMNNLANVLDSQGKYEEANQILLQKLLFPEYTLFLLAIGLDGLLKERHSS
ncbi:hypothetical protein F5Y16DRAFT_413326 [Xylariaceae sp. FL0255]|nr:hypothetical protein F5Y16DRAFT_413326 [Xylariaceae sp. FL0255]